MENHNIFITGFRPFLSHSVNPSQLLTSALIDSGLSGRILDVAYRDVDCLMRELSGSEAKPFIISFGLAAGRRYLSVERSAYNRISRHTPDQDGVIPSAACIDETGPDKLSTSAQAEALASILSSAGLDARASDDPGSYLCNYVYYRSLVLTGGRALFVHLPLETYLSRQDALKAARLIIGNI